MYFYITAGTYDFLSKLKNKYPEEKIAIVENEDGALLLHETAGDAVFKEPRKYEVLDESGEIGGDGFAALNYIPVSEEGRPIFEYRFKNRNKRIENEPGFLAIRVLRPLSSNTYVILTVWENEAAFNNWKKSPSFKETHNSNKDENGVDNQTKIFTSASYITKYTLSE